MPASAGEAAAAHRRRGGGHGSSSGGGGGGGSGCCRLAAALLLLLAAAVPQAHAQTTYAVTATGLTNGTTPDLMGLSLGHAYVDSNWLLWLDWMGVNYARLFVNTRTDLRPALGATFGLNLKGVAVSNKAAYSAAVAQLRTPAGHDPGSASQFQVPVQYRWWERLDDPKSNYEALGSPSDIFLKLRAKGIATLMVLQLTCATATRFSLEETSSASAAYWAERWELYKYVYVTGVWAYDHYVENIEIYNEPNLDATRTGCANVVNTWLDDLRIRSTALQDAYADRQREAPQTPALELTVVGPPMSSPTYTGTLGQTAMKNLHSRFPANTNAASYSNLQRYSYHVAGGVGYYYSARYFQTAPAVKADAKSAAFPVDITEYAVNSATSFETSPQTLDDGDQASRFASMTSYLLRANVPRTVVFKMSQTASSVDLAHESGVLKNGIMFGDNFNAPYDIGDSTLAAEAHGLVVRKLASKQPLLQLMFAQLRPSHSTGSQTNDTKHDEVTTPAERISSFTAFGAADANSYYLYVVNDNPAARRLSVSLAKWKNVPTGGICIVNQVSTGFRAEIAATQKIPASKVLTYTQPKNSLVQFVCPKAAMAPVAKKFLPTDDATVKAGSASGTNFGAAKTLQVRLSPSSDQGSTAAALLKFNLAGVNPAKVQMATLQLHVASSGPAATTLLAFAVGNATRWNEDTVSWNSAPSLAALSSGVVDRISHNYIEYGALPRPRVAGHISVAANAKNVYKSFDITDALLKQLRGPTTAYEHADAVAGVPQNRPQFALLLARIVRRNPSGQGAGATKADPVGNNLVTFDSAEATNVAFRPTLTIYSTS